MFLLVCCIEIWSLPGDEKALQLTVFFGHVLRSHQFSRFGTLHLLDMLLSTSVPALLCRIIHAKYAIRYVSYSI